MPCVQIRSPGRPIVTGNDFVQPKTSCTAAARMKQRGPRRGTDVLAAR